MIDAGTIHLGTAEKAVSLLPEMCNRHGIISGATGTGKTVTLRVLAEDFSSLGVPVFMPDMKGELSGMLRPMPIDEAIEERLERTGIRDRYEPSAFPVLFWDLFGEEGIPLRCSPSLMGPALLSRLLGLNETQSGVMDVIFRVADRNELPILDFKDLQSVARFVNENRAEVSRVFGNVASSSIAAIIRRLLRFEDEGADPFFGEPAFELEDLFTTDAEGRGIIHVLQAKRLLQSPLLYSSFMLWLLSELFEKLPETGDPKIPHLAFFFDEAHLLFDALPKALGDQLEQLIRMIRSKGVAVFFVSQSVRDLPESILAQLGHRVQHGMRAYTPRELSLVKHTADSFRANPAFDTEEALRELGIGEALVSFPDEEGVPSVVEKVTILPPRSGLQPVDAFTVQNAYESHDLFAKYAEVLDRESAYEILEAMVHEAAEREAEEARRTAEEAARKEAEKAAADAARVAEIEAAKAQRAAELETAKAAREAERAARERKRAVRSVPTPRTGSRSSRLTPLERLTNSAFSAVGRELGSRLSRGILGNLLK